MNFPYALFLIEALTLEQTEPFVREKPMSDHAPERPIARAMPCDRNIPLPALGANMAETRENSMH
jgi:hypothetical protein